TRMELDLTTTVAQVQEAGLAVPAATDDSARYPMARLGLDPRRQPLVRGAHLGDVLALELLGRKGIDPPLPQPLELLAPIAESVRGLTLAHWRASLSIAKRPSG